MSVRPVSVSRPASVSGHPVSVSRLVSVWAPVVSVSEPGVGVGRAGVDGGMNRGGPVNRAGRR